MKCFDFSTAVISHDNIIGVSPNSVEGIVILKGIQLKNLIKQKSSNANNNKYSSSLEDLPPEHRAILESAKKYVGTMNPSILKNNKRDTGLNRTYIAGKIYNHAQAKSTIYKILVENPQHWDPYFKK